ncbi:hypothetical protein SERLA73DRAFT_49160 [Serpula lacrymans var. lacrymans S7.3]|uniref:Inosine/uridine-preferring nucleoside hydrolase domain-containing protein n=2 Tax=Serpula lacrymans var. lacrymans TaxID=341189 RepID=F8PPC3_SERL3|nr:hypothetical protein SERLA73DRAFT_49160 [Serpula lacrymans var. lacrymans S7.3]
MMAIHCPNIQLLGVSTVHGNASAECTAKNAARCLHAFGASNDVLVYPGAVKPLIREARHDPDIHGENGLGGVQGLTPSDDPKATARIAKDVDGLPVNALEAMAKSIKQIWKKGTGHQATIVSCGPMTNVALFVSVYPELLVAVEQFVFMGGGVGLGNRSAVAEFNILCDPEAAQIVLNVPVKKVMIPINVTHTAIVNREVHSCLRSPTATSPENDNVLPHPSTNLRHTLSTLISFFADTYKSTFGFDEGPPLHDALTIGYVSNPELFACERYRVDVELNGAITAGETVVDLWNYRSCDESWGPSGKNSLVAQYVNVDQFFALFLECVAQCDEVSPLNKC